MSSVRFPNDTLVEKLMRSQDSFWRRLRLKREKEKEAKEKGKGKRLIIRN